MHTFTCGRCGQLLFFDNDRCMRCGSGLAFRPSRRQIELLGKGDRRCANHSRIGCSWLVEDDSELCAACRLTRTRPPESSTPQWAKAEAAKRILVFQALELDLDLSGVAFDLKSSDHEPVITGHADGVVTIDVNESDDEVRTRMRARMGEAYRTMLGHFRHEIGHYLWLTMVDRAGRVEDFRRVFGDERTDYASALETHYANPPPVGWSQHHVSIYASAHPWEDFAETFAHYLHIRATLQTAAAFGIIIDGKHPVLEADPDVIDQEPASIQPIIGQWLPLTYALNAVNRAMGAEMLYPFVLAPRVIAKLDWVHRMVEAG
ncbi:MAG TPA: putative zinc-binding metallopeptidase [Euzebya sp.]|nr:putative zinc-binding metallopeptidase [Euzebya sp.]